MLHQLSKLEQFRSMITTIITERDHSFISAFNNWFKDINHICYHPHLKTVNDTLSKLKNEFGSKLKHYIEKHIGPLFPYFSRAYISPIKCHGFNTISPAESMNNMIKSSIAQHDITLANSLKEFDRALLKHSMNIEIQQNNSIHKLLFDGASFVSTPILNKIEV